MPSKPFHPAMKLSSLFVVSRELEPLLDASPPPELPLEPLLELPPDESPPLLEPPLLEPASPPEPAALVSSAQTLEMHLSPSPQSALA
jgi:hypothetical protein